MIRAVAHVRLLSYPTDNCQPPQQFKEDMNKLEKLLAAAVAQYDEDGYPLHLSNPQKSAITTMSESDFQKMSAKEVQDTLRHTHLLISDCAAQGLQFDRNGLRTLCSPKDVIEVHGRFRIPFLFRWLIQGCRSVDPSRP